MSGGQPADAVHLTFRVQRYLFSAHDGFGLGHTRRNLVIARAVRRIDPSADVTLVTGLAHGVPWLDVPGVRVVDVPPLVKSSTGGYESVDGTFEEAVAKRADVFAAAVARFRPDVVVVDRHPFGTAGELRPGLELARARGARLVLGLRDILDAPDVVRLEIGGQGWRDMPIFYDEVLVYGMRHFCDHQAEYGLPVAPRYCGWVASAAAPASTETGLLAVNAGGGGDGAVVFRMAVDVVVRTSWRAEFAVGPYADSTELEILRRWSPVRNRLVVGDEADGCGPLFARAAAVLQMAGYNSTYEALAAGHRPVLIPRRAPRAEQVIRAERLAALGLADVVSEQADPDEVIELLDRPRRVSPEHVVRSGIALEGAAEAAALLARAAAGVVG